jgi:hypothetical protein
MLFRFFITLLVLQMHPPFPSEFDLSSLPLNPPCRIFARPAFSQQDCGACAAFAVATAMAVRSCVRDGRDWIPSPYRLFECGGGDCENGSVVGRLVEAMNRVEVGDVELSANVFGGECVKEGVKEAVVDGVRYPGWPHWSTMFHLDHKNVGMIKAEIYAYRNPVLVIVDPDAKMSYYSRSNWFEDHIPVYHVMGPSLQAHVMVAIGWGSYPEPYWLVQNSWGANWGDRGRGRIAVDSIVSAVVLDVRIWREDWVLVIAMTIVMALLLVLEFVEWRKGSVAKVKVDEELCV